MRSRGDTGEFTREMKDKHKSFFHEQGIVELKCQQRGQVQKQGPHATPFC